jgi:hypothetical protein
MQSVVSPKTDLLIDRNSHIQEAKNVSEVCLDTSQHTIPSELAIEVLGDMISVQDFRLPPKLGDNLPCLRISWTCPAVLASAMLSFFQQTTEFFNVLPMRGPEVSLLYLESVSGSCISQSAIFPVQTSTESTAQ